MTTVPPFVTEHRTFAGVRIPSWLRFFDCRIPEEHLLERTPDGRLLCLTDRDVEILGIKGYDSMPLSCSGCPDFRKASDEELSRRVNDAIKHAKDYRKRFNAGHPDKREGDYSLEYQVVAITLCNYGYHLTADNRVKSYSGSTDVDGKPTHPGGTCPTCKGYIAPGYACPQCS
jgi:hypothetical protein